MIVNQTKAGWDIIFQRAHALLAGKIAMQWQVDERPEPWTDVLSAIVDHDDGQRDWQGRNHLTDVGAPLDFTQQGLDFAQTKQTVNNARYRSRWIALLTSMHTSTLYEPLRDTDKDLAVFLDEQQDYQQKLRRSVGIRKAEAEALYRFVFFCDACSLVLCKNEVPTNGNRLELAPTAAGQPAYIFQKGEKFSIDPWPFEESSFAVDVDVFQLKQLSFKDDQELYEALDRAEVVSQRWTFAR
jgi:hypothetical protein